MGQAVGRLALGGMVWLAVVAGSAGLPSPSDADQDAVLTVGAFSTAAEGQTVPPGLEAAQFQESRPPHGVSGGEG